MPLDAPSPWGRTSGVITIVLISLCLHTGPRAAAAGVDAAGSPGGGPKARAATGADTGMGAAAAAGQAGPLPFATF